MSDDDREIQERARSFVDTELIPHEVEAELHGGRLSDDLRSKVDEVLAALAREAQQLRSDKTDRTALASLLTEMAMRLTNEFHLPIAEAERNG